MITRPETNLSGVADLVLIRLSLSWANSYPI